MRKLLSQAYLLSSLQSATWTTNTTVSRGLASLTCSTISKLGIFLRPWQVSKAASSEQRMGTQNHTSFFFGKWSRVSKYLPAAMPITPSAFFFPLEPSSWRLLSLFCIHLTNLYSEPGMIKLNNYLFCHEIHACLNLYVPTELCHALAPTLSQNSSFYIMEVNYISTQIQK